jgi:hypothetical protein
MTLADDVRWKRSREKRRSFDEARHSIATPVA